MTAQEFKIKHPQYSDLGGDDLWNRMELMLLYEQQQKRHNFRKRKWWEYVIIEKR